MKQEERTYSPGDIVTFFLDKLMHEYIDIGIVLSTSGVEGVTYVLFSKRGILRCVTSVLTLLHPNEYIVQDKREQI